MLHQLLSSSDNGQSMVIYHKVMNHAPLLLSSSENGQSMVKYP